MCVSVCVSVCVCVCVCVCACSRALNLEQKHATIAAREAGGLADTAKPSIHKDSEPVTQAFRLLHRVRGEEDGASSLGLQYAPPQQPS